MFWKAVLSFTCYVHFLFALVIYICYMRLGDISIERQVHLLCAVHWDRGFSSLPWHWQVHQTIQLVNIISNDFRHPRFSCILQLVLPNIWDSLREKSTNMSRCQIQCSIYPALSAKIIRCWHFNFSASIAWHHFQSFLLPPCLIFHLQQSLLQIRPFKQKGILVSLGGRAIRQTFN